MTLRQVRSGLVRGTLLAAVLCLGLFIQAFAAVTVNAQGVKLNQPCIILTETLKYKDSDAVSGEQVKILQNYLIEEGVLSGEATGYFGLSTVNALKRWQKDNGINPVGYAGPVTRAKIQILTCGSVVVDTTATTTATTTGALVVSNHPASPSYRVALANTSDNVIGVLNLRATKEDVRLEKINLTLTGSNSDLAQNAAHVRIKDGSTVVGSAYFIGLSSGSTATSILTSNVVVAKDTDKALTIVADFAPISSVSGNPGKVVKVDYNSLQGKGIDSGLTVEGSGSTSFAGVMLQKAYPEFTYSTVSGMLRNGYNDLLQLKITARGGDIFLNKLTFAVGTTTGVKMSEFDFVNIYGGVSSSTAVASRDGRTITVFFDKVQGGDAVIVGGTSKEFNLVAKRVELSGPGSVAISLKGDYQKVPQSTVNNLQASNIIWSPLSYGGPFNNTKSNADWNNGYGLGGCLSVAGLGQDCASRTLISSAMAPVGTTSTSSTEPAFVDYVPTTTGVRIPQAPSSASASVKVSNVELYTVYPYGSAPVGSVLTVSGINLDAARGNMIRLRDISVPSTGKVYTFATGVARAGASLSFTLPSYIPAGTYAIAVSADSGASYSKNEVNYVITSTTKGPISTPTKNVPTNSPSSTSTVVPPASVDTTPVIYNIYPYDKAPVGSTVTVYGLNFSTDNKFNNIIFKNINTGAAYSITGVSKVGTLTELKLDPSITAGTYAVSIVNAEGKASKNGINYVLYNPTVVPSPSPVYTPSYSPSYSPSASPIYPPKVSLSAYPTTIISDGKFGTATLSWSSTNASYCNFEKSTLATSGSITVTVSSTATYTISCTGARGTTSSNPVTVNFQLTAPSYSPATSPVSTPASTGAPSSTSAATNTSTPSSTPSPSATNTPPIVELYTVSPYSSAPAGSTLTIYGLNFSKTQSNIVRMRNSGGKTYTFTGSVSSAGTVITFVVPSYMAAGTYAIGVSADNGASYSKNETNYVITAPTSTASPTPTYSSTPTPSSTPSAMGETVNTLAAGGFSLRAIIIDTLRTLLPGF